MNTILESLYQNKMFDVRLGLETMHKLMDLLGHPERAYRVVHVAGTNGKGSVVAFTSSILKHAGHRVGVYTSPHLERFNERIVVDGIEISDADVDALATELQTLCVNHQVDATFFEFTTAMAFVYFMRKKIDIAVIEVGLGGRLDATNVVTPEIAVITHIGLEHTDVLGATLEKIALEKPGIIKEGSIVATAESDRGVLKVFGDVCTERKAQLVRMQDRLWMKHVESFDDHQEFTAQWNLSGAFTIHLLGKHQVTNACTALMTTSFLKTPISIEAMGEGLKNARWPGRLEVVSRKPFVMLDGAHNPDGVAALCEYMKNLSMRKILVFGVSTDKNADAMVKMLAPHFVKIIVTASGPKPMDVDVLAGIVRTYHTNVEVLGLDDALREGLEIVADDGLLLVSGSLYLVGDARGILRSILNLNNLFK